MSPTSRWQNPWHQEALLEEMPELEAPAPFKGATGPGGGPAHVPARPGL